MIPTITANIPIATPPTMDECFSMSSTIFWKQPVRYTPLAVVGSFAQLLWKGIVILFFNGGSNIEKVY